MCFFRVTLPDEMPFKPVQPENQLRDSPVSKWVTETKNFVGLCSFYWLKTRQFEAIAQLFHQPSKKTKDFYRNSDACEAFEKVKDSLTSSPILIFTSRKKLSSSILSSVSLQLVLSLLNYKMASSESIATFPNLSAKPKVAIRP